MGPDEETRRRLSHVVRRVESQQYPRPGFRGRWFGAGGDGIILCELQSALAYDPGDAKKAPISTVKLLAVDSSEHYAVTGEKILCDYPLALRDSSGDFIGLPVFVSGMFVMCAPGVNGKLSIIETPQLYYKGFLTGGDLSQGGSQTATIDGVAGITVRDTFLSSGDTLDSGSAIGVEWHSVSKTLYVTEATC